jgi:hypothetical protein
VNKATLELSAINADGTKIVFDRTRNIRINSPTLSIENTSDDGNKYLTYVPGFDVSGGNAGFLNTGDPRITYFLRQPANTTLARNNEFTNSSFGSK